MKKIICFICFATALFACNQSVEKQAQSDSKPKNELKSANFQLFQTQNMWTFLKLDTSTGMIWIVQYSVDDFKDTFEIPLSTTNQNYADYPIISDAKAGRYILYPTQNMYTFIMLDQHNGRTWQVQWGTKSEHRFVKKIKALY